MQQDFSMDYVENLPPFVQGWFSYERKEVVQTIPKKTEKVKALIRYYQDFVDEHKEIEEGIRERLVNKAPISQHDLIVNLAICMIPMQEVRERLRQLERALLMRKRYTKSKDGVNEKEVEQAKLYPIERLVKARNKTTSCLWHNDKHPSMHVYKDHAFCFVCNKRADAIDFMRELRRCDFVTAVKVLNGS